MSGDGASWGARMREHFWSVHWKTALVSLGLNSVLLFIALGAVYNVDLWPTFLGAAAFAPWVLGALLILGGLISFGSGVISKRWQYLFEGGLPALVQTAAAVIAVWVAVAAYLSWKDQEITKRKADLAASVFQASFKFEKCIVDAGASILFYFGAMSVVAPRLEKDLTSYVAKLESCRPQQDELSDSVNMAQAFMGGELRKDYLTAEQSVALELATIRNLVAKLKQRGKLELGATSPGVDVDERKQDLANLDVELEKLLKNAEIPLLAQRWSEVLSNALKIAVTSKGLTVEELSKSLSNTLRPMWWLPSSNLRRRAPLGRLRDLQEKMLRGMRFESS